MPAVDGESHLGAGLLGGMLFGKKHPGLQRKLYQASMFYLAPSFHGGKHCFAKPREIVFKENHDIEDAEAKQGWLGDGVVTSYALH